VSLLLADYAAVLHLPRVWLTPGVPAPLPTVLLASVVVGCVHSYLMYSLMSMGMHEGAAHNIVFVGKGRLARAAQVFARHMSRLGGGDPEAYAPTHMVHHAKFGTEEDAEFLNSVFFRRYALTFLPLAAFVSLAVLAVILAVGANAPPPRPSPRKTSLSRPATAQPSKPIVLSPGRGALWRP